MLQTPGPHAPFLTTLLSLMTCILSQGNRMLINEMELTTLKTWGGGKVSEGQVIPKLDYTVPLNSPPCP